MVRQTLLAGLLLGTALTQASSLLQRQTPPPPFCVATEHNPGPGFVCNMQGTLSRPASIRFQDNAPDQATCRDKCLADQPGCVSFQYGPGTSCTTYGKKIINMGFKKSTVSGQTFWNRNCYRRTCTPCPPGQDLCNNQCVDKTSDPNNCGTCENSCGSTASCTNSNCVCNNDQQQFCSSTSTCVTLGTDENCSACGDMCTSPKTCQDGSCQCGDGYVDDGNGGCMITNGCTGSACTDGQSVCNQDNSASSFCLCVGIVDQPGVYGCLDPAPYGQTAGCPPEECTSSADCQEGEGCGVLSNTTYCSCPSNRCVALGRPATCSNQSSPSRLFRPGPRFKFNGTIGASH